MKICPQCRIFYQEQIMICQQCQGPLNEVSLRDALSVTQEKSLQDQIGGQHQRELPDAYKQYHIRSFLKDRSLFLDFDLYKNRLKHGRRLKRFFIAPMRASALLNIPWAVFNVISSNLFHLEYTEYCPRCETKYIPNRHTEEECDYNIEYFGILDDILNGQIVYRRAIYEEYSRIRQGKGLRSAYRDLFCRRITWEFLWDLLSVGSSVVFWLYLIVFVALPWAQAYIREIQTANDVVTVLTLR